MRNDLDEFAIDLMLGLAVLFVVLILPGML